MKNALILIFIATLASSCEKESLPTPAHSTMPNNPKPYNLDWTCEQLGIVMRDVKPTRVRDMVELNPQTGNNEAYGEMIDFYNSDGTVLVQFVYKYRDGITDSYGRIGQKTFIANLESKTINICNSYQNVPVRFDLFSEQDTTALP